MFGRYIILSLCLVTLTGCGSGGLVGLGVTNNASGQPEMPEVETGCDLLRAAVTVGEQRIEVEAAAGEDRASELFSSMEPMVIEAWCVQGGEEIGYARAESGYSDVSVPVIRVTPPDTSGDLQVEGCAEMEEAQGVPICIDSPFD